MYWHGWGMNQQQGTSTVTFHTAYTLLHADSSCHQVDAQCRFYNKHPPTTSSSLVALFDPRRGRKSRGSQAHIHRLSVLLRRLVGALSLGPSDVLLALYDPEQ